MVPDADEALIGDLLRAFAIAVERAVPREMAALMCTDEAESFLDNVSDPDEAETVELVELPEVDVLGVRVFGDAALARFTTSFNPTGGTLFFRREQGRWTVCADAEDDLSLEQLEDNVWPPADEPTFLIRRVHALRRDPIGRLTIEDLRILLSQNEGLDILLPRVMVQLQWNPLLQGDFYPGDLLRAALRVDSAHWSKDPVSTTRMRIVIDAIRKLGDLDDYGAPHDEIQRLASAFLTAHPDQ